MRTSGDCDEDPFHRDCSPPFNAAKGEDEADFIQPQQEDGKMTARSGYGEEGKIDQGLSIMRAVFDSIPDPAHVIDRDYRVVMTNKRLLDLRGLEQEAIVGQPCYAVYQGRDTRCPECAVMKTFESGEPAQVTKTLPLPDGSFRHFEVSAFPVMGEDGSVRYAMELTREITDLKHSETALEKSQDRLRTALEASLDAFFFFRVERDDRGDVRDFILVDANARAERLLRRSRGELAGKRLAEVVPISGEAGLLEKYRQVVETGVALEEEFCLSGPPGSTVWHYHQVAPLEDGVAVCHRNISERKQAEKTLRESEQKFSQAFHHSPIAMALSTVDDGRFLDVNAEFLRMAERQREEVIGHTALELGIWAGPDNRTDVIEQLKKQERVRNVEMEGRSSSGKVLSLVVSIENILINNKPCLLSSAIDITDLKRGRRKGRPCRPSCSRPRRWRPWADWRAAWRMISIIC
jgi:PAS domain S-box-containing protein